MVPSNTRIIDTTQGHNIARVPIKTWTKEYRSHFVFSFNLIWQQSLENGRAQGEERRSGRYLFNPGRALLFTLLKLPKHFLFCPGYGIPITAVFCGCLVNDAGDMVSLKKTICDEAISTTSFLRGVAVQITKWNLLFGALSFTGRSPWARMSVVHGALGEKVEVPAA